MAVRLERFIPPLPAPEAAVAIGGFIVVAAGLDLSLLAPLRFAVADPRWLDIPVGLAALAGAAALMARFAGRPGRREVLATLAMLAVLLVLAAALRDSSWDGEAYHLPAVLALLGGWNPVHGGTGVQYTDIFPSAIWTLQAQLARAFGFVEAGKVLTGLFAGATLLLWSGALGALSGEPASTQSPARRAGLWVLAANPFALSQLTTFYPDADLALLSMCILAGALLAATRFRVVGVAVVCAAAVLAANTKQYGMWYVATVGLGGCLAAPLVWRARLRFLAIGVAAALFGLAVVGWRPFVTGLIEHGTPVYMGTMVVTDRPADMEGVPPPLQFVPILFARTGGWAGESPVAKLPFVVTPREVMFMATPDPRFGGFGPLYGLALLGALAGTAVAWRAVAGSVHGRALLGAAATVTLACALFPDCWPARRVALAWGIPALLVLAWPERGRLGWLRLGVLLALLSSGVLALGGNLARTAWRDHQLTARIERLRPEAPLVLVPGDIQRFDITLADRLRRAGVAARSGTQAECQREIETYRDITVCRLSE